MLVHDALITLALPTTQAFIATWLLAVGLPIAVPLLWRREYEGDDDEVYYPY